MSLIIDHYLYEKNHKYYEYLANKVNPFKIKNLLNYLILTRAHAYKIFHHQIDDFAFTLQSISNTSLAFSLATNVKSSMHSNGIMTP